MPGPQVQMLNVFEIKANVAIHAPVSLVCAHCCLVPQGVSTGIISIKPFTASQRYSPLQAWYPWHSVFPLLFEFSIKLFQSIDLALGVLVL